MGVTDKVKAVMSMAGVRGVDLANALGVNYNSASNRIYKGIKSVDDLIKIVDACGATLNITTKDGTVIPLTLADVENEKQAKNKDK